MLTGLVLAMWIGIGGGIPDVNPTESYDYPQFNLCAVDILCGPGIPFSEYTTDVTMLGTDFTIGPKLYGITGLPNGQLNWDGITLSYATNGVGYHDRTWTPADALHFLFLRTVDNRYFVAIEDLPADGTDGDYNDAIFQLNVVQTPEPGTLLLLGSGLAAVARLARRRTA